MTGDKGFADSRPWVKGGEEAGWALGYITGRAQPLHDES